MKHVVKQRMMVMGAGVVCLLAAGLWGARRLEAQQPALDIDADPARRIVCFTREGVNVGASLYKFPYRIRDGRVEVSLKI